MIPVDAPILVIKEVWLDKILSGEKTLEIRGSGCQKEVGTRVYLSASKSGSVTGVATYNGYIGPLTREEFSSLTNQHCVGEENIDDVFNAYKKVFAWRFDGATRIPETKYQIKKGSITWRKYRPCGKNES